MSDVVVADREFAQLAQTINNSAKMLETYIVYLGNYIEELSAMGGINSERTAKALKEDAKSLRELASDIYQKVIGIVPRTNEFVYDMDRIDDYPNEE